MMSSDSEGSPSMFVPSWLKGLIKAPTYFKIDLNAPDKESMRPWSEWTTKIVAESFKDELRRHTYERLVVEDHELKLLSKGVSCSLFIPLKRNQDEVFRKGQQFDLRGMLEEFKRKVYGWKDWKPGMEIQVSLVRREQIPSYLFTKANHNELQWAPNCCAVENGPAVDIERTIK